LSGGVKASGFGGTQELVVSSLHINFEYSILE
jgi:hypothetical protein